MKRALKYILGILFLVQANSCNTDFLNVNPPAKLSDASVWTDPALVEAFVNDIYRGLGHGIKELMAGSLTDESHFIHNYGSAQVVQSNLTPGDQGAWGRGDFEEFRWDDMYRRIR